MQTSQRGSVLLTIIGGIVILALLGMVAVSLMTGSVMTGLDAKETVQASYLAESGKEIVRVQTSKTRLQRSSRRKATAIFLSWA